LKQTVYNFGFFDIDHSSFYFDTDIIIDFGIKVNSKIKINCNILKNRGMPITSHGDGHPPVFVLPKIDRKQKFEGGDADGQRFKAYL